MNIKKDILEYKPTDSEGNLYETSWYCNEDKIIHKNIKQVCSCKHCVSNQDVDDYIKKELPFLRSRLQTL